VSDLVNLRENWRDEDGSAMYVSPLRTAAAVYIVALEAEVKWRDAELKRLGELQKEYAAVMPPARDRIAELEAENKLAVDKAIRMNNHAADCKRLVTSCEDDIDALRLLNHEYRQDRDKAEAELAALKGRRCETCEHDEVCTVAPAAWAQFEVQPFSCACWAERSSE